MVDRIGDVIVLWDIVFRVKLPFSIRKNIGASQCIDTVGQSVPQAFNNDCLANPARRTLVPYRVVRVITQVIFFSGEVVKIPFVVLMFVGGTAVHAPFTADAFVIVHLDLVCPVFSQFQGYGLLGTYRLANATLLASGIVITDFVPVFIEFKHIARFIYDFFGGGDKIPRFIVT